MPEACLGVRCIHDVPPPAEPVGALARTGVLFGVAMLVFIGYALPFFGLFASLCIPFLTHTARRYLWPEAPIAYSIAWSLTAWAGLWLPGVFSIFTPVVAGPRGTVGWRSRPRGWSYRFAPHSLNAVLLPALAASATCLAGLLGAVATDVDGRG